MTWEKFMAWKKRAVRGHLYLGRSDSLVTHFLSFVKQASGKTVRFVLQVWLLFPQDLQKRYEKARLPWSWTSTLGTELCKRWTLAFPGDHRVGTLTVFNKLCWAKLCPWVQTDLVVNAKWRWSIVVPTATTIILILCRHVWAWQKEFYSWRLGVC